MSMNNINAIHTIFIAEIPLIVTEIFLPFFDNYSVFIMLFCA